MQELITYGIVAVTIFYILFKTYKMIKAPVSDGKCSGCSGCDLKNQMKNNCSV